MHCLTPFLNLSTLGNSQPLKLHFSDPGTHWGWDSDKVAFYFRYTLYILYSHNAMIGIELPLYIHFLDAKRHKNVSAIVSLRELKTINPDISVRDVCLDLYHLQTMPEMAMPTYLQQSKSMLPTPMAAMFSPSRTGISASILLW